LFSIGSGVFMPLIFLWLETMGQRCGSGGGGIITGVTKGKFFKRLPVEKLRKYAGLRKVKRGNSFR
jgi:hypothetical protein